MYPTLRIAALAAATTLPFTAQAYGPDDFRAWLKANQSAEPQFVEGDVITYDKADLVRPFIPTEFQSEWIFDGMEMTIHDAGDLTPAPIYVNATQKFAGTATIAGDGATCVADASRSSTSVPSWRIRYAPGVRPPPLARNVIHSPSAEKRGRTRLTASNPSGVRAVTLLPSAETS